MSQSTTDFNLYLSNLSNITLTPFYPVMIILGFVFLISAIRSHIEYDPGQRMKLIPPAMLVLTSVIGFIADILDVCQGSLEIRPEIGQLCFVITTAMFLWVMLEFLKFLTKLSQMTD